MSEPKTHSLIRFNLLRVTLACYFFLYAYITAVSLIPLPDEPPRINFHGLAVITTAVILGYHALTSSYRFYLWGAWLFVPYAYWQMGKKVKFLEMMLEPRTIEQVAQYTLLLLLIVLFTPKVLHTFHRSAKEYKDPGLLLLKKGVPY